jgi:hypothetical protein
VTSNTTNLNSPIVQLFLRPFALLWTVVTDPFESQDILHRRTAEFDRSELIGDMLGAILPTVHMQFYSADLWFKQNRALISHPPHGAELPA